VEAALNLNGKKAVKRQYRPITISNLKQQVKVLQLTELKG
jgi:hypothetical protein